MKRHGLKAPVSLLLLFVLSIYSFNNFAVFGAGEAAEPVAVDNLPAFDEVTGTLTTKGGTVLLNGQSARTGTTVVNGSTIQTDTGARALIEAGPLGRVDLDPITAILLTYGDQSLQASLTKCGQGVTLNLPPGIKGLVKIVHISDVGMLSENRDLDVKVYRGEVVVKYGQGKERTVKAGEHRDFDNATEVTSNGDAVFKVYCDESRIVPLLALPALAVPFLFAGGEEGLPPFLSTLQP